MKKENSEKIAEISARIDEVISILHTNPNKFAKALGYSRSQTVYDILEGKSAPSYDFFNRFMMSGYSVFINTRWLLTGVGAPIIEEAYYESDLPIVKGEMTNDEREIRLSKLNQATKSEYFSPDSGKRIPLVTQTAAAGFGGADFAIAEADVKEFYVVPKFKYCNVDFMIEISGSSMYPKYNSGDVIACSILHESKFIQWNKCHVIATKEQGILCKRLRESEQSDCITAVSDNKEYPPFDIPKNEITGIALVVGVIRLE